MSSFVQALQIQPSTDEWEEITSLTEQIEALKKRTESFTSFQRSQCYQLLAPHRLQSSCNLKRGNVQSWIQANQWMSQQGHDEPSWKQILELNQILNPTFKDPVRQEEAYLGPWQACPAQDLASAIEIFIKDILQSSQHRALVKAALVHYWLVSLHPFQDGNGRTAVLTADWILALNGYLPQTFDSQLDAIVGQLSNRKIQNPPARAMKKIFKNILSSYQRALGFF